MQKSVDRRLSSYTGCLLGLAAGDGLGHGPDRFNGYLPTSGYTQLAAYACNGLLLGMTQGQLSGAMEPPVRYMADALKAVPCEEVTLELTNGLSPIVMTPAQPEKYNFSYMVLPVRLKAN